MILKDAIKSKKQCQVTPEDVSVMLQYSLLGLNYHEIKEKMKGQFTINTIT